MTPRIGRLERHQHPLLRGGTVTVLPAKILSIILAAAGLSHVVATQQIIICG